MRDARMPLGAGPARVALISALGCLILLAAGPFAGRTHAQPQAARGVVFLIPLQDAVGPATARFVCDGLARAEKEHAAAAIIQLDTPGGLDTSMRQIVKRILACSVPVIVYVAPAGARAASAGLFITLAAPVAAMAPGTNLGAATPVGLGGERVSPDSSMAAKITNDTAAYARALAEKHRRNARWAEQAVRQAASLPAEEALADSVVDLVCRDLSDLLERVDGRTVATSEGEIRLQTRGAEVRELHMSGRDRALSWITNPSIAYLLFLAGILGIALELYHPGAILPGVVGGISLIVAFYAFQGLPVRAAGVLLILLSVVLFLLEVKVPSYGVLSLGGLTSLVLGSLMLFEPGSALRVSLAVLIPAVATFAAFFLLVAFLAGRALRRPKQGGAEGMVGEVCRAVSALDPLGKVFVRGEYWNARATRPAAAGAAVRVLRLEGLLLVVEPADESAHPGERSSS
jgi:membrane-bound serine protease (ClpP class)